MNINIIASKIQNFCVHEEMEDYTISEFFDEIGENINELGNLSETEKKLLIQSLFNFLKNQDPEMDENFSFIHLIENLDKPHYKLYNFELLKFNKEYGTISSILLLNRYINSISGDEWNSSIEILKSISTNNSFSKHIREEAYDYYIHQVKSN